MSRRAISRRDFVKGGVLAAAAAGFPGIARGRSAEKLRIAVVGTGNQADWNLRQIAGEQVVALCDVDSNYLDKAAAAHREARRFRDFREMLSASIDFDAVLVAAPDHIHGPAAAMALRRGKHVYCEKPLAHSVDEVRTLSRLAAEKKLVTQMGIQIHAGGNYRRVVELVRSGAIGRIREVHVWCERAWSGGRYGEAKPAPAHLDWNLWLGPAAEHAFCDGIHPAEWRRFWSYGAGTLGDMACHHLDLPFWALDLKHPRTIQAEGPPADAVGAPAWLIVRYEFPEEGGRPPVTVTWYDGGKRPERLAALKTKEGAALEWGDGTLFVGEEGLVIADYGRHLLLRDNQVTDFTPPEKSIPESIGHHAEWIAACKAGSATTCNFDYAGVLTEAVLLGVVSYRVGRKLDWNAKELRAAGCPEADRYIRHEYRKGWEL